MEVLDAVRLTSEAARRFSAGGRGRVHSAFVRTVNLELDGLGEAGWLSLHGPGPIPAPFGIACAGLALTAGLGSALIRLELAAIVLEGRLRLRLDRAVVVDTALPSATPPPSVDTCFRRALPVPTPVPAAGLLPAAATVLRGASPLTDALGRVATPALARLHAATSAEDAPACLAAARPLLGLGPGLTPSGDDCLVGWLAGMWTGGRRELAEAVGPALLAAARERTTALSCAFLAAAVAGQVAEPLRRFVGSPDATALRGLLALGATSGRDLLAGYLLARHALVEAGGGRRMAIRAVVHPSSDPTSRRRC